MKKPTRRGPFHYKTHQIDLPKGQQLRITHGRRTVFIWTNGSGLHIGYGGCCPKKRANPEGRTA